MKDSKVVIGVGLVALDVVINENIGSTKLWAGGSCGNVMTILGYLGWSSYPIAFIGEDYAADVLLDDIARWNVRTDFIMQSCERRTPIVVERFKKGEYHKFGFKCPFCNSLLPRNKPLPEFMAEELTRNLPKAAVFYFDRVSKSNLLIAQKQKAAGALIFFEPHRIVQNKLFSEALEIADIVKYSGEQINSINTNKNILEIQTLSERGLKYRLKKDEKQEWRQLSAFKGPQILDTAGAGDWCTAGLINFIGQKGIKSLDEADNQLIETGLRLGQCLAAIKCAYEGPRGLMYETSKMDLSSMIRELYLTKTFNRAHKESLSSPITRVCPNCPKEK